MDLLVELTRLFKTVKKHYMKKTIIGSWTNLTLELEHSGKFSIDYGYEDIYLIRY